MKILFVCLGNVARSQIAEAYYNYFTSSKNAESAGVLDYVPDKYKHSVPEVIEIMKEEDIDVSRQKVKCISLDMVERADKIYVLCEKERCPDFLQSSKKVTYWDVEDPFNTDLDNFRKIRDLIKSKVQSIIKSGLTDDGFRRQRLRHRHRDGAGRERVHPDRALRDGGPLTTDGAAGVRTGTAA